jgi:hypothetical protein
MLSVACQEFKAYLLAADPFPESTFPAALARQAWARANERENPGEPPLPYTDKVEITVSTHHFYFFSF